MRLQKGDKECVSYALVPVAVRNVLSMCQSSKRNCPTMICGWTTPEMTVAAPKLPPARNAVAMVYSNVGDEGDDINEEECEEGSGPSRGAVSPTWVVVVDAIF